MRHLVMFMLLLSPLPRAAAEVNIQIALPGINIGINQPIYPNLVAIPGYPVYYDPGADSNYFFYDGMYWVYAEDNWYASSWFNGPWELVGPHSVPVFMLRIPVSYYRHPPTYFRGWQADQPPRWGEHWGNDWEQKRGGWDRWDHNKAPAAAPLPAYQKQYAGDRYPEPDKQRELHGKNYRHEPKDAEVKQAHKAETPPPPAREAARAAPAKEATKAAPAKEAQRSPPAKEKPRAQPAKEAVKAAPAKEAQRSPPAKEAARAQPARAAEPNQRAQGKAEPQKAKQEQGQQKGKEPGREQGKEQGREREK